MLVYQVNIELQEPERILYLAIPEPTYERMSRQRIFEVVAKRYTVNLLVYDPIQKSLVKWIHQSK